MCIIYIMITVYNNISVTYLKKQKQTRCNVCTYKQIIFYIISVFASPLLPYYFLLLLCCCFFLRHRSTTTEAALEKKTDDKVTNRVQILQRRLSLF